MKLPNSRRVLLGLVGVVPLVLSLVTAQPAFAATARSDVSITFSENHSTAGAGQPVTYTARMTNHGPDDASFVDTVFVWPSGLRPISINCDLGISPDSPNCEYSSLKAGQTVVSTFVAAPRASARGKTLTFKVHISYEVDCSFDPNCTFDPNTRNNSASVKTKVR